MALVVTVSGKTTRGEAMGSALVWIKACATSSVGLWLSSSMRFLNPADLKAGEVKGVPKSLAVSLAGAVAGGTEAGFAGFGGSVGVLGGVGGIGTVRKSIDVDLFSSRRFSSSVLSNEPLRAKPTLSSENCGWRRGLRAL